MEFKDDTELNRAGLINRFRHIIRISSLNYRMDDMENLALHFLKSASIDLKVDNKSSYFSKLRKLVLSEIPKWKCRSWETLNIRGLKNEVYKLVIRKNTSKMISDSRTVHSKRPRGRPSITNETLLELLKSSNTSTELREAICKFIGKPMYNTIGGLNKRICGYTDSEIKEELRKLRDEKFSDY